MPPSPLEVVSAIAPTPLLVVHGDRDAYFPLEHFRSVATAPLVERIGRRASATIGP